MSVHPHICKRGRSNNGLEDDISGLPDEILVSIISRLTIREAATTSVLSSRWKFLWTFFSGRLHFEGSLDILSKLALKDGRRKYVNWMNQALKSHQGSNLYKFQVYFDLDFVDSGPDIDSWVHFASDKRVQIFEMLLRSFRQLNRPDCYTFPSHSLDFSRFHSLVVLRLSFVDVTGDAIESFISNSPLLQALAVEGSRSLVNLKVSGPSLNLKHLVLSICSLENLEISAPNLVTFTYIGQSIRFPFRSVPRLVDVCFKGEYCIDIIFNMHLLVSYISCLERLTLYTYNQNFVRCPDFPTFGNLKELSLMINAHDNNCLLSCISMVNASPVLTTITVNLISIGDNWNDEGGLEIETIERIRHEWLKVVVMKGFVARTTEAELLIYLFENSSALEEVLIHDSYHGTVNPAFPALRQHNLRLLETKLPPGVDFKIRFNPRHS